MKAGAKQRMNDIKTQKKRYNSPLENHLSYRGPRTLKCYRFRRTSSFMPGGNMDAPAPDVYCTSKLSPSRLARKNNEFPIVVIP